MGEATVSTEGFYLKKITTKGQSVEIMDSFSTRCEYIQWKRRAMENCLRHGLTKPSRPHSGTPSREDGVRKVQEYDDAAAACISRALKSTPRRT